MIFASDRSEANDFWTIDPVPDELVRTLVGRMEILTPEDVDATVAQVKALAEDRGLFVKSVSG